MCGFAGVVTWDEKYRVTRDTLEKMSRAIAHDSLHSYAVDQLLLASRPHQPTRDVK